MLAKKGSLDKNFGQKILDGAKYAGKEFILPMAGGSAIVLLGCYILVGITTKVWTPKQIKEYNRIEKIKTQIESELKSYVDYRFNRIFEDANAKTFQDSVDIYQKYGLPIKLLNPTLIQKEKTIKQNELERSVR